MKLAWTYADWTARWPSFGSDEWFRHTLVIPWPWAWRRDPDDGEPLHRAVCIVIRPWWACRLALNPENRHFIRWHRGLNRALGVLPKDPDDWPDGAWDAAYDGYLATAGEQPPLFA